MLVTRQDTKEAAGSTLTGVAVVGRVQALPAEVVEKGQPPFGAAMRLGQAPLFLQVFEAIHSACLTLKLFATVLLHSVDVLLQSGVHAM